MPLKDQPESLWRSFRCAFAGITRALTSQRNVRIHLIATLIVLVSAALLRVSLIEWAILVLTVGLVIVAELLNTAIEAVVDLASPDFHELARIAKDVAAGAVLVAAVVAVAIGMLIFGPAIRTMAAW